MDNRPIGVFDSGVGGLAVVRQIRRLLPAESIVYYADTAHFPYGEQDEERIRGLAADAAGFLVERGAKTVVVACNTASSVALAHLRSLYSLPFVGMVPAVKPASSVTRTGKVGVMATGATVHAKVLDDLIAQFADGVSVITRACPGLVEFVERGEVDSERVRSVLRSHLDPMLAEGIDVLVLGCTHYPFLMDVIAEIAGDGVQVIDTALPVARQLERVLAQHGLEADGARVGGISYFASGDKEAFLEVARRLCRELC